MRHAKAVPAGPGQGDLGRALNGRGRRAAREVARELHRRGARPDLILCSPSRRTRETLDGVLAVYEPAPHTLIEPELYLAEATRLVDRFRRLSPDIRQALLIGHNEGLAEAAIALAMAGDPAALASLQAKFPTGAVAWLRFPMEDWTRTGRTRGELLAFVRPRDLTG